jgi:hypothetical protein
MWLNWLALTVTDIKTLIEAEVKAMLVDFRKAAPSEKVALAKAISALASALPEFGATSGGGLAALLNLKPTKETKDD